MSEQKDYISGLQISGKKYEINAKYLSGKELNDLMTIYIWDISNIFGKNIDVQNNTEISVGLIGGDIFKYVSPVYKNYLDKKPIYVFNGDNESPIILPAIVSIVDDRFNVYVYTTSKDTNYNQIYGTYSFSIKDLLDDGSMIVTASNYVHRFIEDGDISLKTINGQSLLGSGDINIDDNDIKIIDLNNNFDNIVKQIDKIYNKNKVVYVKYNNELQKIKTIDIQTLYEEETYDAYVLRTESIISYGKNNFIENTYQYVNSITGVIKDSFEQQFYTISNTVLDADIFGNNDILNYEIIIQSYFNKANPIGIKINDEIVYANSIKCDRIISETTEISDIDSETKFIATFINNNILYDVTFKFVDIYKSYMIYEITNVTILNTSSSKHIGGESMPFDLTMFTNNNIQVIPISYYNDIYNRLIQGYSFIILNNNDSFKNKVYSSENVNIVGNGFSIDFGDFVLNFFRDGNLENYIYLVELERKVDNIYIIENVNFDSNTNVPTYVFHDLLVAYEKASSIVIDNNNKRLNSYYFGKNNLSDGTCQFDIGFTNKTGVDKIASFSLKDDGVEKYTEVYWFNPEKSI